MTKACSRRQMLRRTTCAALAGAFGAPFVLGASRKSSARSQPGVVVGEEIGAAVGQAMLTNGGNAIDALVAGALASCVANPSRCGIGGYGGHAIIALAGGKKVTAIDFNSMAPAGARPDMYPLDETGEVKGRINFYGWLAAGVPGTLAGLYLALERYGTRPFREVVKPAIELARKGFVISPKFARTIQGAAARFRNDPGSAKLYLKNGEPCPAGELLRNPDLADLLSTLAKRNSMDAFYRGDVARSIAESFEKNGGLVTAKDLAAYHAREVTPLLLKSNEFDIYTAPLTAGGLTVLEGLSILRALPSEAMAGSAGVHARLEAMRLAWKDRLELLGDPEKVNVPVTRLLSADYAREMAAKILSAVTARQPVPIQIRTHPDEGTCNLSSTDRFGNLAAVTFTQGSDFGAQVTVDGLGLTLGHGMSRFNPRPGHPNSPGPGKRPLHNMCPSAVLRDGKPVLAVGATGGVRIPSALYDVLTQFVLHGASLYGAIAAPRAFCTGTLEVTPETSWPIADADYLRQIGFKVQTADNAVASAVSFNPKTGECHGAMR